MRNLSRYLALATVAACLVPLAAVAASPLVYLAPTAMAAKIRGATPQLQTGNTAAPSMITATVCQGTGTAKAKKFNTFKCAATWSGGKTVVWARALPKNQFCASTTGLSACPATPALPGDPRICHSSAGAPLTADPNHCSLLAAQLAVVSAMKVTFKDDTWAIRDSNCKGQNVTWSCEYSSQTTFGTYYDTTIKFAHSTGTWVATLSTQQHGSTATPISCTVSPAAAMPAGQNSAWAAGPPATCSV